MTHSKDPIPAQLQEASTQDDISPEAFLARIVLEEAYQDELLDRMVDAIVSDQITGTAEARNAFADSVKKRGLYTSHATQDMHTRNNRSK